jgi:hypothetical protein
MTSEMTYTLFNKKLSAGAMKRTLTEIVFKVGSIFIIQKQARYSQTKRMILLK